MRPGLWTRLASWLTIALAVGFVVFCGVWRLDGGRWVHVETPSMGEVAPVGSLLWIKPTEFDSLKVGDFITFHPPGQTTGQAHGDSAITYSHRVHTINDDGTISTKGVIPAPDPWKLTAHDVVGKVRMNWWGVGWLVVAGPVLIIGFLLVGLARSLVRRRWKLPITLVASSLVLSLAIVLYQPFSNAQQLAFAPAKHGGANATYVGTGLLPIQLSAHDGPRVVLSDGEVGTVHITKLDKDGKLRITLKPAIPFWWWIALVLACFIPAFYSLAVGRPPRDDDDPDEP